MRAALLIGANFVREQRWPLITLMLYVLVFGIGMAIVGGQSEDDTLFLLRSTPMYGLAFTALMAASAIQNERRSRRILAVLSKGIERGQYLAGLLTGLLLAAAVYCATIVAVGVLTSRHLGMLLVFAILLMTMYLYAGTAALAFSTFLHPLFAVAVAALSLTAEGVMGHALGGVWGSVLPAWTLVDHAANFGAPGWQMPWGACVSAVAHAAFYWAIATVIFSRRDIAMAIE